MNLELDLKLNRYLNVGRIRHFKKLLNTTLDRLYPNAFSFGFFIDKQSDTEIKAKIPFSPLNIDLQNEIRPGIAIDAGCEMIRVFLDRNLVGHAFRIADTHFNLNKKLKWSSDLNLTMEIDPELFELKIIEFQKIKKFNFEFSVNISTKDFKKIDTLIFKLEVQKINLLSQEKS